MSRVRKPHFGNWIDFYALTLRKIDTTFKGLSVLDCIASI